MEEFGIIHFIMLFGIGIISIFVGFFIGALLLIVKKDMGEEIGELIEIETKKGVIFLPGRTFTNIMFYAVALVFFLLSLLGGGLLILASFSYIN